MSALPPANPRLVALLHSFATHMGLPPPAEGLGLELQDQDLTLRILGDAQDGLLIEVDIGAAEEAPAPALALLHRINHVARLRHGWQISLDEDNRIVLHTRRSIARTDAGTLERLLDAALERAASLQRLWHKTLAGLQEGRAPSTQDRLQSLSAGALRG